MPEYICNCCAFKSKDKTLYKKHLETVKHKRLSSSMEGEDNQLALINENTLLKEEIQSLKKELQTYKQVIKDLGLKLKKEESEEEEELYNNWDPTNLREEVDIDIKDVHLIETIAGLRTSDDLVETITIENAFDAFFRNEKNNLPFVKDYLEMLENPNHLGDVIIKHVLDNCSFKVTDKYKGRFKLYKDGWIKHSESYDMLTDLIMHVWVNIKQYNKIFQHYYTYDSKLREINPYRLDQIKPKIRELDSKININSETLIEYICEKMC